MPSLARRELSADECAIVVQRRGEPLLVRGPATVRTFWRWKQVVIVNLSPLLLTTREVDVGTSDGSVASVELRIGARVTDPLAATAKAADYREATRAVVATATRAQLKEWPAGELLSNREQIQVAIREQSDEALRAFGVTVSEVQLHLS